MTVHAKASLRIMGEFDIESLSREIGLTASYSHKKGEIGRIRGAFNSDMWRISAPLDKDLPLQQHLEWLVEQMQGRYEVLERVKQFAKIDIFCSITSGEQGGFSLSPKALSIFNDLQINMEVSLILMDE
jgi:hypothetical protein